MTKGRYQGNRRSRPRRKADLQKVFTDRIEDLTHFERLLEILGYSWSYVVYVLVFLIVASLLYLMFNTDLLTPPRENTLTDGAAAQTDEPPVDAPSVAELEAQEPIDITDGTWSFSREAQSYVLYTMDFESDGTFDVP
ncbi:MAG: hypothetical protein MUQ10_15865, partial [Anaerolineae bacterium]|nr:hypothetical protein [Anaerolineae bacterium]